MDALKQMRKLAGTYQPYGPPEVSIVANIKGRRMSWTFSLPMLSAIEYYPEEMGQDMEQASGDFDSVLIREKVLKENSRIEEFAHIKGGKYTIVGLGVIDFLMDEKSITPKLEECCKKAGVKLVKLQIR